MRRSIMANVNSTLGTVVPAKTSRPERIAQWLHQNSMNWRPLFGFVLITLLGYISIRFNYELGMLSAVDETSQSLLPYGYALLDLCCLFLAGYVGIRSRSRLRKFIAWVWFTFLLSLSLWAAASFTLAIDSQQESQDLTHAINQQKIELESLNQEVEIWRQNVSEAVNFKTKHQNTLKEVQSRQRASSDKLHVLESQVPIPTMAIYEKTAPLLGLTSDTLNLIIRLCWAAAVTLSPLILSLIGFAEYIQQPNLNGLSSKNKTECHDNNSEKTNIWSLCKEKLTNWHHRKKLKHIMRTMEQNAKHELKQDKPEMMNTRAFKPDLASASKEIVQQKSLNGGNSENNVVRFPSDVEPKKGHNQHTTAPDLNGVKYALEWLTKQPQGRITRAKLSHAAKIHTREGVSRIINTLIERGFLVRIGNGQLYTTDKVAIKTNENKETGIKC